MSGQVWRNNNSVCSEKIKNMPWYIYEHCSRHDSTVFSHTSVSGVTYRILCYAAWENKAEWVVLDKTLHMHWQIIAEWRISHANIYVDKILCKLVFDVKWSILKTARASGDLHGYTVSFQLNSRKITKYSNGGCRERWLGRNTEIPVRRTLGGMRKSKAHVQLNPMRDGKSNKNFILKETNQIWISCSCISSWICI